jgi:TyrR family helix-turn-helix protein
MSMFYLRKYNEMYKQNKRFSETCLEELQAYDFPGNVRELKNIIKNAVVIKEDDELVKIIPAGRKKLKHEERSSTDLLPKSVRGINEELFEFEHKMLQKALPKFDSTRDLADYLRISQSTVVRKLKKHGLSLE